MVSIRSPVRVKDLERSFTNWACSCPRWTRNADRPMCKHIKAVQERMKYYGDDFQPRQAEAPESLERFVIKYENAFAAVELD